MFTTRQLDGIRPAPGSVRTIAALRPLVTRPVPCVMLSPSSTRVLAKSVMPYAAMSAALIASPFAALTAVV